MRIRKLPVVRKVGVTRISGVQKVKCLHGSVMFKFMACICSKRHMVQASIKHVRHLEGVGVQTFVPIRLKGMVEDREM